MVERAVKTVDGVGKGSMVELLILVDQALFFSMHLNGLEKVTFELQEIWALKDT